MPIKASGGCSPNPANSGFPNRGTIPGWGVLKKEFEEAEDESAATVCSECGMQGGSVIGCPDGTDVCQACFDARHR